MLQKGKARPQEASLVTPARRSETRCCGAHRPGGDRGGAGWGGVSAASARPPNHAPSVHCVPLRKSLSFCPEVTGVRTEGYRPDNGTAPGQLPQCLASRRRRCQLVLGKGDAEPVPMSPLQGAAQDTRAGGLSPRWGSLGRSPCGWTHLGAQGEEPGHFVFPAWPHRAGQLVGPLPSQPPVCTRALGTGASPG